MSNKENIKNKAWEAYKEEFELGDYDIWQWHLWARDEDGKRVIDITEENITKCEKLYKENSNGDNFNRLLVLKIFAGKECKELTSEFLNLYDKRKGDVIVGKILGLIVDIMIDAEKFSKGIETSLSKMRAFFLWLIDVRPNVFKEEIYDLEFAEYRLCPLCTFLGEHNVFKNNIDLKKIRCLGEFDITEGPSAFYILSEYCYKEGYWLEAFCLYEKARALDKAYGGGVISEFENLLKCCNSAEISEDSTQGDLKSRSLECFENTIKSGDTERLYNIVLDLNNKKEEFEVRVGQKESDEKVYFRVINIFNKIANKKYEEAFSLWTTLTKENIKIVGLDSRTATKYLKNLKDKRGSEEFNRAKFFAENPKYEDKDIIDEFSRALNELVRENLIKFYGKAYVWYKGVPSKIHASAIEKKRENPNFSLWQNLSFSDYLKIIEEKNNWNKIFRKHFIVEKDDARKSNEKLTSCLSQAIPLRNKIQHPERGELSLKDRQAWRECWSDFRKVYDNWKNRQTEGQNIVK